MTLLTYGEYTAEIAVDANAKVLAGHVLNIRDGIVFEGNTVAEIEEEFHRSVDDYRAQCAEMGREPERPYSGNFVVRTSPATHRAVALAATRAGKTMNAWVEKTLAQVATMTAQQEGENHRFVFTRNSLAPGKDHLSESTDIFAASLAKAMEALVRGDRTHVRIFEEFVNNLPHDTEAAPSPEG